MSVVTFDTLQFVQTLTESGFEQKQAEGMAKALRNAQEETEAVTWKISNGESPAKKEQQKFERQQW